MRYLTNHARNNGTMSNGNTLFIMVIKAGRKVIPACGCAKGSNSGHSSATIRLMMMVYDVVAAESPPSFCVTTAQAVAVGQIMASMKPSITNRASVEGNAHRSRQQSVKSAVCASSSHRCQRCGRRSDGFILQKETKSIRNSNSGCNSSVIQSMLPFTSAVKGNSRHRKYAKAPLIIDTGRVQFLRNCIKGIF